MSDEDETITARVIYTMGRSGGDTSTYCQDLDSLIGFFPILAPGDYWICRCVVKDVPGGYRDPIDQSDWGVVRVDAEGGFVLQGLAGRTTERRPERDQDLAFRDAWTHSTLPGPGREG